MYKLVSTFLKPKGISNTYQNIDISLMTVGFIQDNFLDGYIELSNVNLDDNVFLTIQDFRQINLPYRLDQTFEYWLSFIGNKTILNVTETRPNYVSAIVKARNAMQSDFKIKYVDRRYDPDKPMAIGAQNDLYLSKPYVDKNILQRRMLTTVNGYLHPTVPYQDGVAVVGGGSLVKTIGDINVGILSFASVGDLTMKAITNENLFSYKGGIPLSEKCIVSLDTSLIGKSVIVVIAGYPIIGSDIVSIASDEQGILNINTRRFDIVTHLNRQLGKINLESLGILNNGDIHSLRPMSKQAILSDLITRKYLTLPQSFVIIVDTPELTIERIPVVSSGIRDVHINFNEPNLPIIDSYGRIVEYWVSPENNVYSIITANDYYKTFNYETVETNIIDTHNLVMPVGGYQQHSLEYLRMTAVRKIENN